MQTENLKNMIDRTQTIRLYKRICPHCHCEVPVGIGRYPVYRIAMLGGKGCGKTTYMLLTINQMVTGEKTNNTLLNELHLADGKLIGESRKLFDELMNQYQNSRLASTQMDTRSIFPLVMCITSSAPNAPKKPFFLIMQDFPGEGMKDAAFMINNQGILGADGAILLIDPEQLRGVQKQAADADAEVCCTDSLDTTLAIIKGYIQQFTRMRKIVVTLHKVDRLYQGAGGAAPHIRRGDHELLDQGLLSPYHQDAVNTDVLERMHTLVCHILQGLMNLGGDTGFTARRITNMLGCDEPKRPCVSFKAISGYSWSEANQCFISGQTATPVGIGHRMLEPILELLCDAQLLPVKRDPVPARWSILQWFQRR